MALTKAQVSLVTVATIGAAPGGFTADLMNLGSQKEVANLIATLGTPEFTTMTNAEFVNNVAKNLGTNVDAKDKIAFLKALEDGATRADAAVDFANAQLVEHGRIPNVDRAANSTSTSTVLAELKAELSPAATDPLRVEFKDQDENQTTKLTDGSQTISNIGKAQIDADAGKISKDFTFALKNQIGEKETFKGEFLSPILEEEAPDTSGSKVVLELRNLREAEDSLTPLKDLPTNGFGFEIDGELVMVQSDAIDDAETYADLLAAIKARVEELGRGENLPEGADAALYANLATFTVDFGTTKPAEERDANGNITKTHDVTVTEIILTDEAGSTLNPRGYTNRDGIIDSSGFTLFAQMADEAGTSTQTKIATNLEADNVGYGSQGATVNLVGQSNSDKGIEELNVTATNGVWFTKLQSQKNASSINHLETINLVTGSEGYFRVGTQKNHDRHLVDLVNENFANAGLVDVQQLNAGILAGSVAVNSYISDAVINRFDLEDIGLYTTDDPDALISYTTGTGADVVNLAISTQVLAQVDTQVKVNTGAGDDIITVMATEGANVEAVQEVASAATWLANQQQNNNIEINAGAGNDWILTPGAGNATILAGAGNDVVRVDNSGDRALFVFNNDTITNIDELKSNNDNALSSGATTSAQTHNFFKAQVQVTFKGFESAFVAIDYNTTTYTTNNQQINQAIKKAINDDPVLKTLLAAHDNGANALGIESLIDGALAIGDLGISIIPPVAYDAADASKALREATGQLMLANGEDTKAIEAYAKAGAGTVVVGAITAAAGTVAGVANYGVVGTQYATEYATSAGTTGSTVASVTGTAGPDGAAATPEVLAEQTFDFSSLTNGDLVASATITITIDGEDFVYTAVAADAPADIAAGFDGMTVGNYTATDSGAGVVTITQTTGNGAPIADGTVAATGGGSDAAAANLLTGTSTVTGFAAVAETLEVQTLDLSTVTVAAGESMIFTIDGTDYAYTNNTGGDLDGTTPALAAALQADLTVPGYTVAVATNDITITQDAGNGSDIADITTVIGTPGTSTTYNGTNSLAESDNVIDLGTGQDVLVLGTGALSNDTVVFEGINQGHKTIVNFTGTGTAPDGTSGDDLLDFTSYLTNVDASTKARIDTTVTGTGDFSAANEVKIVDYDSTEKLTTASTAAITFENLSGNDVRAMINNNDAASGELDIDTDTATTGTLNYVLMVHNTLNVGEYKAFHVTSTVASADDAATVQLIGTFDFGDDLVVAGIDANNFA